MRTETKPPGPDLRALFALFGPAGDLPAYEIIPADQVPQPYHKLLVHEHHMTVTVESHHGDLVNVKILAKQMRDEDGQPTYARKILLTLQKTGKVVQFGIMRVRFEHCSAEVRDEIVAGNTPLGRILIEHDVLRRIEPTAYLRLTPNKDLMGWFSMAQPKPLYGRLALIHCDGKPAVELLEIVAPEN